MSEELIIQIWIVILVAYIFIPYKNIKTHYVISKLAWCVALPITLVYILGGYQ